MDALVKRLRGGVYGINRIPLCAEAADEIERLRAENFSLAAGQCANVTADDFGAPRCAELLRMRTEAERLRSVNTELLEALQSIMATLNEDSDGKSNAAAVYLEMHGDQARATIAKATGGKS